MRPYWPFKEHSLAHTQDEKEQLLTRVRRIKGQVTAIERALEEEHDCSETMQQIAACRGAMNGLMSELLEGEVKYHILSPNAKANSSEARAAEELISVIRRYLK